VSEQQAHVYETEIEWIGEKKGELRAPGLPPLTVATPPEFRGHEGMWSPEHYFVASVNACIMTTFLAIAEFSRFRFLGFQSVARGKLEKVEGQGYQITEIVVRPRLIVAEERDRDRGQRLLEKAEKNCLISNSIKTVVRLEPEVNVAENL